MPIWISAYNYDFALATIPIQLLLFAFYVERRYLPIRQSRTFLAVMVVNFIMTAADIISCEMNEVWRDYSLPAMYAINMMYFLGFLLRGWFLFQYTAEEVYARKNIGQNLYRILAVPVLIVLALVLTTPFTGWIFGLYDDTGYRNGLLYRSIYYSTYFYIAMSLAIVFYCRHEAGVAARIRLYLFNGILIAGILMRGWFVDTLVTSYFSLMAILVIYLGAQNPGNFIEKRGKIFNETALSMIVREYVLDRKFFIEAFVIRNYSEMRELYSGPQMDEAVGSVGQWLREEMDEAHAFYLRNGCFVLVNVKPAMGENIRNKIKKRFQQPWRTEDSDLYLAVSTLRISEDVELNSSQELLDGLNIALGELARAKRESHLVADNEYVKKLRHRVQVKRALEQAVENDTVEIYLQPIVSAETYELMGAEALARITDPELGFLPPAEFIPLAEQNGSIGTLGGQVFRKSCAFLAEYESELPQMHWVHVNLSPVQCMDRSLAESFIAIKESFGLDGARIPLEITEESFVNPQVLRQQIDKMQGAGFQFVLDDYGSGYSNAMLVKSIPFVNVKIDISMVRAHFQHPDNFLPNTIRTFRDMGFSVTVEGVETKEMAEELSSMGASYLQGYYFSKPMPVEHFVKYAKKRPVRDEL